MKNITKSKIKKFLKNINNNQTNKIKKNRKHFRKKNFKNFSLKKRNDKTNIRFKTLKYGGAPEDDLDAFRFLDRS